MDIITATKTVLTRYVDFKGRSRRAEYWWFIVAYVGISIVANIIDMAIGNPAVSIIVGLAIFLPSLAVTVRRLHDTDRRGWWILSPLIGAAIAGIGVAMENMAVMAVGDIAMAVGGITTLILYILIIVWLATKGTDGDNRFGADPLAE